MPGRPERARRSSTCWSRVSTARPASGCWRACWPAIRRSPARAPICRRAACRSAGADRPATPTAMSGWWRPSASARRRTTSSPPRPTTTARRATFCAAWPSRASPPPTSCCSRSPSGPAMTDRWAMPRAPSSTGCPPRSPCRRWPMPAGRSSARPSRHSGPAARTWTCRSRSASPWPASSACTRRGWANSTPTSTRRSRCCSSC